MSGFSRLERLRKGRQNNEWPAEVVARIHQGASAEEIAGTTGKDVQTVKLYMQKLARQRSQLPPVAICRKARPSTPWR